ncbi:GTPase IMAP family member 8-like [Labrus bergylta]|uniref:GTPase IMAP family member 8-like n=1 Tax=Labrus bergylta TaxID=56723 RepID=UPI003313B22B
MAKHNGVRNTAQMMVISSLEEWFSFKSLLQNYSNEKHLQLTFSSLGSNQVCDLAVDGRSFSLHYAALKEDLTEEGITLAIEGCFKSCTDRICTFLLLIEGGHFTKRERRMIEILQAHFGAEALKYLVVLSLEDGKVAETMDDALLELITMCNRRYSQITAAAAHEKLCSLLDTVDQMTAYTEAMLTEAKRRSTEDAAMRMLKEKEQVFKIMVQREEERRAKEMEELMAKHAEERKKEADEGKTFEKGKESLEEPVVSHRDRLQLQMNATEDNDDTKKKSVILLGLSGSGKSSALNLILERTGNKHSNDESSHEAPQTLCCERKQVLAAGRKLVLVDTPELWDEDEVEDLEVVKDCLSLSYPGPHVFLLVLQVGRFTRGESEMLQRLQKIFGRELVEYAIVLFISFDGSQKIDDYVMEAHATLQDLIRKCGSRYYVLNAAKSQNALSCPQVENLLSGINKLVASHGGRPYPVRRFTEQELQERRRGIEERKEGALEMNYLLKDD